MKTLYINSIILLGLFFLFSCGEDYLDEKPLDRFSPENLLINQEGYETALYAIYDAVRLEHQITGANFDHRNLGSDVVRWGRADSRGFADYTLLNSSSVVVQQYWDWGFRDVIPRANLVLENIDDQELEIEEGARNNIKGQALFFRAYAYNILVTFYGGVPIVDKRITEPRFDFVRDSKDVVLNFIIEDLELAGELLAEDPGDGMVSKAAAFHLLSEAYISLGMSSNDPSYYDKAVNAASKIINQEVGSYQLITSRFGSASSSPGDVISDLHNASQLNKSEGNTETIWTYQIQNYIQGGFLNYNPRWWAPSADRIATPNGTPNLAADSLLRGIGVNSPTDFAKYFMWDDPNDLRNSKHNIRRTYYYNNPADQEYFGKEVKVAKNVNGDLYIAEDDGVTLTSLKLDTVSWFYPWIKKLDGPALNDDASSGRSAKDIVVMRLAETYLLRAEAYFRSGKLDLAAADINTVRNRANASSISVGEVTEDFILDERARELIMEEARVRTLLRMDRLVDRVKKYNSDPVGTSSISSGNTIQERNRLWPIPLSVIDANTAVVIQQNDGY